MRFAIVDNERTLPSTGLTGTCPACARPVIARCGSQRIHHWAHRGQRECDDWWEPETEWHRRWKMNFPNDWQEVIRNAESGEKHIADVRTPSGLTIEFQHSHLRPDERTAREGFYRDMVWVVDGCRLCRDLPRFNAGMRGLIRLNGTIFAHHSPENLFPRCWLNSNVPVFFDFHVAATASDVDAAVGRYLWGLLPQPVVKPAIVLAFPRDYFIHIARVSPNNLLARDLGIVVMQMLREYGYTRS